VRYTIYLAHLAPCPGGHYTCEAHILGAIMLVRPLKGESGVGGLLYSLIQGSPFKAIPIVSTLCLKGSTPFVALTSPLGSLSLDQTQEAYKWERPPWVNALPNTLNMAPINNMGLPSSQSLEKA
jgi:hypothetical protein